MMKQTVQEDSIIYIEFFARTEKAVSTHTKIEHASNMLLKCDYSVLYESN